MFELLKKLLKAFWQMKIKNKPVILSHEVNSSCNLRCDFCSNWRNEKNELSKEEIFDLIDEAKDFGIILYNIWATEPLLRDDIGEIINYAKEKNLLASLVTNGVLLEENLDKIKKLDYLTVSLDGLEIHEKIRNTDVDKILEGMKKAKKKNISVGVNCVINQKNLSEIPKLIDYCKKKDYPISFEPIHKYEEIKNDDLEGYLLKNKKRYKEIIDKIKNKKEKGAPIINSKTYLKEIKNPNNLINCNNKLPILHIDSEGKIKICRANKTKLGSYKDGIGKIWKEKKQYREKIVNQCDGCQFFGYAESIYLNNFKIEPIKNVIRYI